MFYYHKDPMTRKKALTVKLIVASSVHWVYNQLFKLTARGSEAYSNLYRDQCKESVALLQGVVHGSVHVDLAYLIPPWALL